MESQKVLVVSHNAFSQTNNMGKTLKGLFNSFDKDNMAQLYFHILNSDVDMCKTSFNITDRDVLNSIIRPNSCGRIINEINPTNNLVNNSKVYKYGQKRTATKHILRDTLWNLGHWKSKDLINWIEDFKPTVVFLAAGYSMFSINIALFIAKKFNIPLVTYFCDDYYDFTYSSNKYSLISNLRMKLYRKKINEVVNKSSELIFISESMRNKYDELFNKKGQVIMTPSELTKPLSKKVNTPLVMTFVGSVLGNRWLTLREIGKSLENINSKGQKIVLNIYSVANDSHVISQLSLGNSMVFKGAADSELVKKIYRESDILLHVESFESKDVKRVKHSISTKIADCLVSNRTFLAVGPKGIASIDYLTANNAAYIIDNEQMIEDKLIEFFIDNEINDQIKKNAQLIAEDNHNLVVNSERLMSIFEKVVTEKE